MWYAQRAAPILMLVPQQCCWCWPGRSETEVEYSVGFDSDGLIQALDCQVWCLGGTVLDICFSDIAGVMTGLNQVTSAQLDCNTAAKQADKIKHNHSRGKHQPRTFLPTLGSINSACFWQHCWPLCRVKSFSWACFSNIAGVRTLYAPQTSPKAEALLSISRWI